MNIQLKIEAAGRKVQTVDIAAGQQQTVIIEQPQGKVTYELVEQDSGKAPERIFSKRNGNDLEITFEGSEHTDLIIKDYYTNEPLSPVIGQASNGKYYAYIAESGVENEAIALAKEGVLASQVLAEEAIVPFVMPEWGWWLAGLAAVGAIAAAAGGGSSSSSDNTPQLEAAATKAVDELRKAQKALEEELEKVGQKDTYTQAEEDAVQAAKQAYEKALDNAEKALAALPATNKVAAQESARVQNVKDKIATDETLETADTVVANDVQKIGENNTLQDGANGTVDQVDEATVGVVDAENAAQAFTNELTAFRSAGTGRELTPEQYAKLKALQEEFLAKKAAAQDSVNNLDDLATKSSSVENAQNELNDRLDALNIESFDLVDMLSPTDALEAVKAAVEAAKAAEKALNDKVTEAQADGEISPEELAEIQQLTAAAEAAKASAQKAVDTVQAKADQLSADDKATLTSLKTDADAVAINPTALIEQAKAAEKAAEDALAEANKDGKITPEEAANLTALNDEVTAAKKAAEEAIAQLPTEDQTAYTTELSPVDGIDIPAVNDASDAKAKVKAAQDAQKEAEAALARAKADNSITPAEAEELEQLNKKVEAAKQAAAEAVAALPDSLAEKAQLAADTEAVTTVEVPETDPAKQAEQDVINDLVEKAEAAEKAAEEALAKALEDGVISDEDLAEINELNEQITAAKQAAKDAVEKMPSSVLKDQLEDRLDDVDTVNGVADQKDTLDQANDAADNAVDAVKDALNEYLKAIDEAKADGAVNPNDAKDIADKKAALDEALAKAQDAIDNLQGTEQGVQQKRLDNLQKVADEEPVPAVNDENASGVPDVIEAVQNALDNAKEKEQAAKDLLAKIQAENNQNAGPESAYGQVSPEQKAALEEANKALDDAKKAVEEAKKAADAEIAENPTAFGDTLAEVNAQLDDLADQGERLQGVTVPSVDPRAAVEAAQEAEKVAQDAVNKAYLGDDAEEQKAVDNAKEELAKAEQALEDAKAKGEDTTQAEKDVADAKQALEDARKAATEAAEQAKADGKEPNVEQLAEIEKANEAVEAAKETAQEALANTDENYPGLADLKADEAAVAPVALPEFNKKALAEELVKAAEAAEKAALDKLAELAGTTVEELEKAVNEGKEPALTGQELEDAVRAKLAEDLLKANVSPEDQAEVDALNQAAEAAKAKADEAVKALDEADQAPFAERLDNVTPVDSPKVTDKDGNGVNDLTDALKAVAEAEAKADAAKAKANAAAKDGVVTPEEKAAIEKANQELDAAKEAAQKLVDALDDSLAAEKADLNDRLDAAQPAEIPANTDADKAAEQAVEDLAKALKAAEDALAEAQKDNAISPEEAEKLQALKDAVDEARKNAEEAIAKVADDEKQAELQDKLDAVKTATTEPTGEDNITVPAVNDTDNDGLVDTVPEDATEEEKALADQTNAAKDAVKAAQEAQDKADKALEEALKDGAVSPEELKEIQDLQDAANQAKEDAEKLVADLPKSAGKDDLEADLAELNPVEEPTVNDENNNGLPDDVDALLADAIAAKKAADKAKADAEADGLVTPEEAEAVAKANEALEAAKQAAQEKLDALPDSAAKDTAQARLDNLTPAEVEVNDADGNGIADDKDALAQALADAEEAVKKAEEAEKAAQKAADDAEQAAKDAGKDGISAEDKAKIDALNEEVAQAKAAAQEAIEAAKKAIEEAEAQDPANTDYADEAKALEDLVARENDVTEVDVPALSTADKAAELVKAAEEADQAAKDALEEALKSDGGISDSEKAELEKLAEEAAAKKAAAEAAVNELPDENPAKEELSNALQPLDGITVPDASPEATAAQAKSDALKNADDLVKAAEDAEQAALEKLAELAGTTVEDVAKEVNEGQEPALTGQALEDAVRELLADKLKDALITPEQQAEVAALNDAVNEAKEKAQKAVDALGDDVAEKADLADRLGNVTNVAEPAVTDKDGNGINDVVEAKDAVTAAENAQKAAQDAIDNAKRDGEITPEEAAEIAELVEAANQAKEDAQAKVDQLDGQPEKSPLQARLDDIPEIEQPAEALIAAAEEALAKAEEALNNALKDGAISQDEVDELNALKDAAEEARTNAQNAINALPEDEKAAAQAKLDEVKTKVTEPTGEDNITVPAVNDTDNDGLVDTVPENATEEEKALADQTKAAEDAVKEAEEAYKALEDAIADAGDAITPEEAVELAKQLEEAQALKDKAQELVDALPESVGRDNLDNRLDQLDTTVPAANDENENGIPDEDEKAVQDAIDAYTAAAKEEPADPEKVAKALEDAKALIEALPESPETAKAAKDAAAAKLAVEEAVAKDNAAQKALEDAKADGKISQGEVDALQKAHDDAQAAKEAAQKLVDALPEDNADKAGLNDTLAGLNNIDVPTESDPVATAEELIQAAKDAEQAAEEFLKDAEKDGLLSGEEQAKLDELNKAIEEAKAAAEDAINNVPEAEKKALTDDLATVTSPVTPSENTKLDDNNNGIDNETEKSIEDLIQKVKDLEEEALAIVNNPAVSAEQEKALEGEGGLNDQIAAAKAEAEAAIAAEKANHPADSDAAKALDEMQAQLDAVDAPYDVEPSDKLSANGVEGPNGVADEDDAKIAELLKDAQEKAKALDDAIAAAKADDESTDLDETDVISKDERAALEVARNEAVKAKKALEDAIAALPESEGKTGYEADAAAVNIADIPAMNDADGDGKHDAEEAVENAEAAAVELDLAKDNARDAAQNLEDAKANGASDDLIAELEKAKEAADQELAQAQKALDDAKAEAEEKVNALPEADSKKDGLTDRLDDLNGNGIPDDIDVALEKARDAENALAIAEDKVAAAQEALEQAKLDAVKSEPTEEEIKAIEDAEKALTDAELKGDEAEIAQAKQDLADALKAADTSTPTPEQQKAIEDAEQALEDAKAALPAAEQALAEEKQAVQDLIDALPADKADQAEKAQAALDDLNENGVPDATDDKIEDLLAAAKAAVAEAEQAIKEAEANGSVGEQEAKDIQALIDKANEAKQAVADELAKLTDPAEVAAKDGYEEALNAIEVPEVPKVTDADNNGIHDAEDKVIAAEKAAKALDEAQDKLREAEIAAATAAAALIAAQQALANAEEAIPEGTSEEDKAALLKPLQDEVAEAEKAVKGNPDNPEEEGTAKALEDAKAELEKAQTAATEAEKEATDAVNALVDEDPALHERLAARLDDLNDNGLADDAEEAAEKALEEAEEAGRDYYNALNNPETTPEKLAELKEKMDNAEKAAKDLIDGLRPIPGKEDKGNKAIEAFKDRLADLDGNKEPDDVQDYIAAAVAAERALKGELAKALDDKELSQQEAKDLADEVAARNQAKQDALKAIEDAKAAGDLTEDQAQALTDKVNGLNTELPLEKPTIGNVAADGTVTGTATPGSTVTLKDDQDNVLGTATADENGNYSIPTTDLAGKNITAESTMEGKTATESEPLQMLDKPVLSLSDFDDSFGTNTADNSQIGSADDKVTNDKEFNLGTTETQDGATITYEVSTDGGNTWKPADTAQADLADGTYQYRPVATKGNQVVVGDVETVKVDTTIDKPTVTEVNGTTITGTAEPNSVVLISVDDITNGNYGAYQFTKSVKVGEDGTFSIEDDRIKTGAERIAVKAIDEAGNVSEVSVTDKLNMTDTGVRFYGYNFDGTAKAGETRAVDSGKLFATLANDATKATITFNTEHGSLFGFETGVLENLYSADFLAKTNTYGNLTADDITALYKKYSSNGAEVTLNLTRDAVEGDDGVVTFGNWAIADSSAVGKVTDSKDERVNETTELTLEKGKITITGNGVEISRDYVNGGIAPTATYTSSTDEQNVDYTKPNVTGVANAAAANRVHGSYDVWINTNGTVVADQKVVILDGAKESSIANVSTVDPNKVYITIVNTAGNGNGTDIGLRYTTADGKQEYLGNNSSSETLTVETNKGLISAAVTEIKDKGFEVEFNGSNRMIISAPKSLFAEDSEIIAYVSGWPTGAAQSVVSFKDAYTVSHKVLPTITPVNNDGSVSITPNDVETMIITYTPEAVTKLTNNYFADNANGIREKLDATDQLKTTDTITATKSGDTWALDKSVAGITIDSATGKVSFEPNAVADGTTISVKETANGGAVTAVAPTDTATTAAPDNSSIYILDGRHRQGNLPAGKVGSVNISSGANNNNRMVVEFTPENADEGQTVTLTFIREPNAGNRWYVMLDDSDPSSTVPVSFLNGYVLGTNSKGEEITLGGLESGDKWVLSGNNIHIPADALKDGSKVTAWESNGLGLGVDGKNVLGNKGLVDWVVPTEVKPTVNDIPVITPAEDGSVVVKAGADNTSMTISYYSELANNRQHGAEGMSGEVVTISSVVPEGVDRKVITEDITIAPNSIKQLRLEKDNSGNWVWSKEEDGSAQAIPANVELDQATGTVTFKPDAIMGNTPVNATGVSSGTGAQGLAEEKLANRDVPTNLELTIVTTTDQMTQDTKDKLKALTGWSDDNFSHSSWVIMPVYFGYQDNHKVRNVLNYTFEYVNKNDEVEYLKFEVREYQGQQPEYGKAGAAWYIQDPADGEWKLVTEMGSKWYSYHDMIFMDGDYINNHLGENGYIKLWTNDERVGGVDQLLDGWTMGQGQQVDETVYTGNVAEAKANSKYWFTDFFDGTVSNFKNAGGMIDLTDGKATEINWINAYYIKDYNVDGKIFIKGDANDIINLGEPNNNWYRDLNDSYWVTPGEWKITQGENATKEYDGRTYQEWYHSTTNATIWIDQTITIIV